MYVINPAFARFQLSLRELMNAENIPTGRPVRLYLVGTLPDGRAFEGYDEITILPM
ncbi:MAG TPA: hypothetical protein VMN39_09765 [Longimicrobiaceae bacterium]|nr:hypothetical protein [Longimicrobiaceae bacterium]